MFDLCHSAQRFYAPGMSLLASESRLCLAKLDPTFTISLVILCPLGPSPGPVCLRPSLLRSGSDLSSLNSLMTTLLLSAKWL